VLTQYLASVTAVTVRENVCIDSENVKSHVFLDFEKRKKHTHSFTGHLLTRPLITHYYRKSVPESHGHQHQTSCSEVQTQEIMQLQRHL